MTVRLLPENACPRSADRESFDEDVRRAFVRYWLRRPLIVGTHYPPPPDDQDAQTMDALVRYFQAMREASIGDPPEVRLFIRDARALAITQGTIEEAAVADALECFSFAEEEGEP